MIFPPIIAELGQLACLFWIMYSHSELFFSCCRREQRESRYLQDAHYVLDFLCALFNLIQFSSSNISGGKHYNPISQIGNPARKMLCSSLQLVEELGFELRSAGLKAFHYAHGFPGLQFGPNRATKKGCSHGSQTQCGDSMALLVERATASCFCCGCCCYYFV